jgi:integrase
MAGVHMSDYEMTWWTLSDVVDWVRRIDPTATIGQIRLALEDRCASNRIRTHGHRRVYGYDQPLPIGHWDPTFVQFADEYGEPRSSFDAISAAEWKDLTFFARPAPGMNEPYHAAITLALDQLASPVELRSVSKRRLAWKDVEFWRDDVIAEWPHTSDGGKPNEAERKPRSEAAGEATCGRPVSRSLTKGPAPLSNRDLRLWYEGRVAELMRRGETSSGEDDWGAAKQEFAGRVTRARVRGVRERCAPVDWKKQGRRSPRIAK